MKRRNIKLMLNSTTKNDSSPTVSVIMPIFNVELYLRKAIDSVLSQSFDDFELILINDGSTDNCLSICRDFEKKDPRVKVISRENKGLAMSREEGVEKARGRYVYLMDSDDYIEPDMLNTMVEVAEKHEMQIVMSGFYMEYYEHGRHFNVKVVVPEKNYNDISEFQKDAHIYLNKTMLSVVWNKLIERSLILDNDVHFKKIRWDDHHFVMELLKYVDRLAVVSDAHYHWYRSRKGSDTEKIYSDPDLFIHRVEQFESILGTYKAWGNPINIDGAYKWFMERAFQCVQEYVCSDNDDKRKKINEICSNKYVVAGNSMQIPYGKFMRICIKIMETNNFYLIWIISHMIRLVKNTMPRYFFAVRSKRN